MSDKSNVGDNLLFVHEQINACSYVCLQSALKLDNNYKEKLLRKKT